VSDHGGVLLLPSFSGRPHLSRDSFEAPPWWLLQCATTFCCGKGLIIRQDRAELGIGRNNSPVLGDAAPLILSWPTALASLFMWIFITSGLVSDTQLHAHVHIQLSTGHITNGLCVWERKQVSLGVKFALGAWQTREQGKAWDLPGVPRSSLRRPAKVLSRFSLEIKTP
jgi:hypothetical protein